HNVASYPALHHLTECGGELTSLFGANEARKGLLENFILSEPPQMRDGVVRLQDFPLEVGDEDRVRRICDDDIGGEKPGGPSRRRLKNGISHGEVSPFP